MLENNLKNIKERIFSKCKECNRNADEITLVAVSKQNSISAIKEAKKYGINHFGENKAQELKEKNKEFSNNISWHFIGHLQSNKVKDVVPITHIIHSVDSVKIANEINKRSERIDKVQKILLEINTSGEETKFGLETKNNIIELANFCKKSNNLNLVGLMTMAPYSDDDEVIRTSFRSLKNIFDNLNSEGYNLSELSMGMTNDFELAIEEGATILRIGTAIFGSRY